MSPEPKRTSGTTLKFAGLLSLILSGILCVVFGSNELAGNENMGPAPFLVLLMLGVVIIVWGISKDSAQAFQKIEQDGHEENAIGGPNPAVQVSDEAGTAARTSGAPEARKYAGWLSRYVGLGIGVLAVVPGLVVVITLQKSLQNPAHAGANDFSSTGIAGFVLIPVLGLIGGDLMNKLLSTRISAPQASVIGGIVGGLLFPILGIMGLRLVILLLASP